MSNIDTDILLQFIDLTGADPELAQGYLQAADGSIDQAVELFFANDGAPIQNQATRSTSPPRQSHSRSPVDEDVRAPISHRTTGALVDDFDYPARRPQFRQTRPNNPFAQNVWTSGDAFRDIRAEAQASRSQGPANDKANRLAELFRPPIDLIHRGDFDDARREANDNGKWLMFDIQDPTDFQCQVLNRDLWKDEKVKDIIRSNFVFCQYSSASPDGDRFKTFYPFDQFPHIVIVDPRTREQLREWNVVPKVTDFVIELMEFLDHHSLEDDRAMPVKKQKKQKSMSEMTEEEQLEWALQMSRDSAPISLDSEEEELQKPIKKQEVKKDEVEREIKYVEPVASPKKTSPFDSISSKVPPEPTPGPNTTRIQFRLPDGTRQVRAFNKTDLVRNLFEYVKGGLEVAEGKEFDLIFPPGKNLLGSLEDTLSSAKQVVEMLSTGEIKTAKKTYKDRKRGNSSLGELTSSEFTSDLIGSSELALDDGENMITTSTETLMESPRKRPKISTFSTKTSRTWLSLSKTSAPKTKAKNSGPTLEQMILDFGQKDRGPRTCQDCGMTYNHTDETDDAFHVSYHKAVLGGVDYSQYKDEAVVDTGWHKNIGNYRIVVVSKTSSSIEKKKAREIVKIVNQDLGAVELTEEKLEECKIFILVTAKNKAIGCVVAEPKTRAFAVSTLDNKDTTNLGTEDAPLICSSKPTMITCGISRIWVVRKERRNGVAAKLLDSVCTNFRYPLRITPQYLAFSQPTMDGRRLAQSYTKTAHFLVYVEE